MSAMSAATRPSRPAVVRNGRDDRRTARIAAAPSHSTAPSTEGGPRVRTTERYDGGGSLEDRATASAAMRGPERGGGAESSGIFAAGGNAGFSAKAAASRHTASIHAGDNLSGGREDLGGGDDVPSARFESRGGGGALGPYFSSGRSGGVDGGGGAPGPETTFAPPDPPPPPFLGKIAIEFDTGARGGVGGGGGGPVLSLKYVNTGRGAASSVSHPPSYDDARRPRPPPSSAAASVASAVRLLVRYSCATTFLLPPLVVARRVINSTGRAVVDYFTGRYFRTTYTRLERAYLRYYEFPAAIRSACRTISQATILLALSAAVRRALAALDAPPCRRVAGSGTRPSWLCGVCWMGAVVGTGHACATALAVWGGPLRVQAAAHGNSPREGSNILRRIVEHPAELVRDMEEWKYLKAFGGGRGGSEGGNGGGEVFDPDPLLFPATWLPLRWLQIVAIAKAFATDPSDYQWCSPDVDRVPALMKQYLIQLALSDEWHRVFVGEKRIGLGIAVISCYFVALVWMVVTAVTISGAAGAMLVPSVLAAVISGSLNVVMFWNRMGAKQRRAAMDAMGWGGSGGGRWTSRHR